MSNDSFNTDQDPNTDQNEPQPTFSGNNEDDSPQTQDTGNNVDIGKLEKRLNDKDQFIETLKQEKRQQDQRIAEMEEKLNQVKSTEEILQELESRQSAEGTQSGESDNSSNDGQSAEEILRQAEERVMSRLTEQQQKQKEQDNFKQVQEQLTSIYGDQADETVRQKAQENDMDWNEAVQMASRNPKLFMKLFGTEKEQSQGAQPTQRSEKPAFNQENQQQEKKKVMVGPSKTQDVVSEWRRNKPEV